MIFSQLASIVFTLLISITVGDAADDNLPSIFAAGHYNFTKEGFSNELKTLSELQRFRKLLVGISSGTCGDRCAEAEIEYLKINNTCFENKIPFVRLDADLHPEFSQEILGGHDVPQLVVFSKKRSFVWTHPVESIVSYMEQEVALPITILDPPSFADILRPKDSAHGTTVMVGFFGDEEGQDAILDEWIQIADLRRKEKSTFAAVINSEFIEGFMKAGIIPEIPTPFFLYSGLLSGQIIMGYNEIVVEGDKEKTLNQWVDKVIKNELNDIVDQKRKNVEQAKKFLAEMEAERAAAAEEEENVDSAKEDL